MSTSRLIPMFGVHDPPQPPVKYIKINGVKKLNPEYTAYEKRKATGGDVTNLQNADTALPIIRNMEDHARLCTEMNQDIPLADATDATIDIFQDPDICKKVNMASDELVDALGKIFAKYEIPMGLMNKLLGLSSDDFDLLEFIIDDSGSMGSYSDYNDGSGKKYTRWEEVSLRLKSMIEILAYLPIPPIRIKFLNRRGVINITRGTMKPEEFIKNANIAIAKEFSAPPSSSTPYLNAIKTTLSEHKGRRVARYLFGDGEPDGGEGAIAEIKKIVINRYDPKNNPITLLSCTDDDNAVEWMKELEESASYCAELDDFHDEYAEVIHDQGIAMPFNRGFHLICQLVAAINPEDLDAMDESVPFTKYSLDNLLGIETSLEDYKHYFTHFIKAQKANTGKTQIVQFKMSIDWNNYFNEFAQSKNRETMPIVIQYRRELKQRI